MRGKGKTVGATGAVCAVATMITIVLGSGQVRTNEEGLRLIGGYESCQRDPYLCPANKWTDGIGNTTGVTPGVRKSDAQIAKDWERNIKVSEACINRDFRGQDMPDDTFSAMTSAAFNMGCTSLKTYFSATRKIRVETSIHKWAQKGNWVNMCNHLPDFNRSGGRVLAGLTARRQAELALCLKGVASGKN